MIATTVERVERHTDPRVNERIRLQNERSISWFRLHPEEISDRLDELDREWDIERVLATMSSGFSLATMALSVIGKRRWLLLTLAVQGFYLQHSLQGWCPPLPALRALGVRTPQEIEHERNALLALRSAES